MAHAQPSTQATHPESDTPRVAAEQLRWLGGGFVLSFVVPFVFADVLDLPRDLYYGINAASVLTFVALVMTATYHAGYSGFRSEKMVKPLTGDVIWSVPTLVTLNPIGSVIAHVGLHVTAVLHSYDTDTFLPPHETRGP